MLQDIFEKHLANIDQPSASNQLLTELVAEIRPRSDVADDYSTHMLLALCQILESETRFREALLSSLFKLLGDHKPVSLYADLGIQPNTGFFSEVWRRFAHKLLPDAVDDKYAKDVFASIFSRPSDAHWVLNVPNEIWQKLLTVLGVEQVSPTLSESAWRGLLDGLQVLSYRISSGGLEPELIQNHPELEDFDSPFIVQNQEVARLLALHLDVTDINREESQVQIRHTLVILDQCVAAMRRIRLQGAKQGTSLRLTFLLQRLAQQIDRARILLAIIGGRQSSEFDTSSCIELFKTLVDKECHKNDLQAHWQDNVSLLALRITENASRIGDHYITSTRKAYFELLRASMGAGFIIAFMAACKIYVAKMHFPPMTEALLFSLNYGLGFVFIHLLHFTVATKQPAMTAAAIAASIGEYGQKSQDLKALAGLIAQTVRSQMAAILGNVILAIPMAMLIELGLQSIWGVSLVSQEKADHLLADLDPVHGLAIFYAALAGVCLFLSGLIAGYHDNLALYNKIPQRLRRLKWLDRLLGTARLDRVATYVENNLGALAGNFYFGFLLGGIAAIGVLFGLPLDIRHITFSSANLGFSNVAYGFHMPWQLLVVSSLGVLLIGLTNLAVSFGLALYVAMRSRGITFAQWRVFLSSLFLYLKEHPREFLWPPKVDLVEDDEQAH